ncbi:protein asteroid homolog 1-like isoform X1 [Crassostrea angulata]|uniref:protein asteroid homolog 1-like isoform X1 n=1 Tax=Magallana angulata TaxID=2784310 RepID=UPI0022B11177|nr:protein asteroid homolog 1-like isoform X1 [Crassostrea angulata]
MGIKGLTTFMKSNPQLMKEIRLHDTEVVIDGNSLYHFIFYSNQLDFLHGGDYDQYAYKIIKFFNLLHCYNIQPYIVFDGGNDPNDMKFQTSHKRMKQRLEMAMQLAKGHKGDCKVMPILAFDTFRAVLKEIMIPFAVCDFEADIEIAKLANKLNCPVLSDDSDFYIFPLTAGFIPFESVSFTEQETRMENDSLENFLSARRYHVNNFVHFFPSLGRKVLHLIAALLGNDYVDTQIFKPFYSSIWRYEGYTPFSIPITDKRTLKVILWLRGLKTYEDGISAITSRALTSQHLETIQSALKRTKTAFTFNASDSTLFPHFKQNSSAIEKSIRGQNGSMIPEWYVCYHRQGILPPSSLDIITLRRKFLIPQVEDPNSASSYRCSAKLREYMYGILLSEDIEDKGLTADMISDVEEYDRKGHTLLSETVYALRTLTGYGELPYLSVIPNLSSSEKENILRRIIDMPSFSIDYMTKDLELVLGIVLFWIKRAKPHVTIFHLHSILVCLIMLKLKWVLFHHGTTGCKKNLIEVTVLDMTGESLKEVFFKLNQYSAKIHHTTEHPVDSSVIHGFAQFQTCLMGTMHLNSLLMCPFPNPCIHHLFSGTFLYNVYLELKKQESADLFIHKVLLMESSLAQIHQCLFDAVINAIDSNGIAAASRYFEECTDRTEKKKKHKRTQRVQTSSQSTGNRFSVLYMRESDED